MIKTVIIDKQADFCDCIKSVLLTQEDFQVCGTGKDVYDALSLAERYEPDVILMEFDLADTVAHTLPSSIKKRSRNTEIIFVFNVEAADDANSLENMARSGVPGCISRQKALRQAATACRKVCEGEFFITKDIAVKSFQLLASYLRKTKIEPKLNRPLPCAPVKPVLLNRAEHRIACCVGQGLSNKDISQELGLSEGTVRNYISLLLKKTGLRHRTQIALYSLNGAFVDRSRLPKRAGGSASKSLSMPETTNSPFGHSKPHGPYLSMQNG
ncbi:MAG: response regulator transcription factor [Spirochaetaceae bacterium]|jgi:DNA-binding NarL/FixJ family response regulator|nr:response regulator transcription factor [Spirochaetaceae bacterium]